MDTRILKCSKCGKDYEKWYSGPIENNLCPTCNAEKWAEWEKEEKDNMDKIKLLQTAGHTHACSFRMVFGDGEYVCGRKT